MIKHALRYKIYEHIWTRVAYLTDMISQKIFFEKILLTEMITILCFLKSARTAYGQDISNTPPILYVPERNWLIPETEQVGQIITRLRAEDPENDNLVFGIEPRFLSNYNDQNKNFKVPFRIDRDTGVVSVNETLLGRGGEHFFLYITVSDGVLTAKNEVYVNIIANNTNKLLSFHTSPSVASTVHNISEILPSFHTLPKAKYAQNMHPVMAIMNPLHPTLDINTHTPYVRSQRFKFRQENDTFSEYDTLVPSSTKMGSQMTRGRVRLKAVKAINKNTVNGDNNLNSAYFNKYNILMPTNHETNKELINKKSPKKQIVDENYPIKAVIILFLILSSGLILAGSCYLSFIYRKRFCVDNKKFKPKNLEEVSKKCSQINLDSNSIDENRNSLVLQNWTGPAHNNRYIPWEIDAQHMLISLRTPQLSSNGCYTSQSNTLIYPDGLQNNNSNIIDGTKFGDLLENVADYDKSPWQFPRHRLKFFNILGEGAFGQVWRCEANNIDGTDGVTTVAVKTLKENATEAEKKDLIRELEIMKSLGPHINVVRLLGCCTEKDPMLLIIEFVNMGKLQTYLRNSRAERFYGNTHGSSIILTSSDLTSFMYQVAKGMNYLSSRGIIHRDLAARNILIMADHTCKVADFGFARDIVSSKIYERKSEGKMPIRWMAIESLYDNIFSTKSDIWSYGILMWEIVTLGSTPYPGISASDVMRKVRDGYRLEKPAHCRRELYNIMYYCWASVSSQRPAFTELGKMLGRLMLSEMEYIQLDRFPDHNYYNIINLSGEKL